MNEQSVWKQKLPVTLTTLLGFISLYFMIRACMQVASIIVSQIQHAEIIYGVGLFGNDLNVSMIPILLISIFVSLVWLFSTRVAFFKKRFMRVIMFLITLFTIWGNLGAYGMSQAKQNIVPYFEERLLDVIETDGFFESIVFDQTAGFYLMMVLIPMLVLCFILLFLTSKYIFHEKELKEAFFEYEWSGKWLQKFSKMEQKEMWPDVELGANSKTGEMLVLPGRDRTLNSLIIGSIGTGKTAALAIPTINQDLHHMTRYINDYPNLYEREDFLTEDVGGRYLSGISIIEPSNDLCQKSLQLVKAHGIPNEAITYINPLDPHTVSINPMRGPVDKVAEVFAQVIAGLSDSKSGGNSYFEQAQRNHLKQYVYLLKLHDTEYEVTFDDLIDMYNNAQVAHEMHVKLKTTIPSDIDLLEDREERNYWKIVQGVDEWFDLNLIPKQTRQGNMTVTERDQNGNPLFIDAKAEHVQGLRNILNDLGSNPLIRRVLFGKSDFDFDRHMAVGGVLLVNTAKGDLVNLARVLGKIVLMNLQNASFRRPPMVSSFHHILVDEAPDYLYNAFREFPAQSRKYKVIITTLNQTIAQLADQFGDHYMTTLIGTMRNRMVYGDVPAFDAKYFSEMFGEKFVYQEGQTEASVSPLQENPLSRTGSSFQKVREQAMTGGDIMFQEAFQCAVKIVSNNKPMPVVQIQANFVPKNEFKESVIHVDEESLQIWLEQHRLFLNGVATTEGSQAEEDTTPILSIDETEEIYAADYKIEKQNAFSLHAESIEKTISTVGAPRPGGPVNYTASMPERIRTKKCHTDSETSKESESSPQDQVNMPNTTPNSQNQSESNPLPNDQKTDEMEIVDWEQTERKQGYQPSLITEKEEEFGDSLVNSLVEDYDENQ